ncbi:hypothetical protein [Serratia fonticola]|uniref:hypothetical protein n=1 Tax=Serratia fonticola TaxID=47917 RepID=UPI00217C4421|nr:hypothetical protein [Serratia fonticola]CAI1036889.1 Uncharacterised protein [Serratia fonticola]
MSDKLEALSQPVGLVTNQLDGAVIVESDQLLPGDNVYSQEYVTALLAALEEANKRAERLNGMIDNSMRATNAAEQREGHLKATVDVLSAKNAELEQRLQQPIKLPNKNDDEFWFGSTFQVAKFDRAVERAILAAGFKVEGE